MYTDQDFAAARSITRDYDTAEREGYPLTEANEAAYDWALKVLSSK